MVSSLLSTRPPAAERLIQFSCLTTVLVLSSCARPQPAIQPAGEPAIKTGAVTISVLGTSDFHGALDRLPILAGFVGNLRAARAEDGGVVLIDAGDMFQGTIESNYNEGAAVIAGYNALDYTASVIGNHEFDFGP
ncbi:MAG: metallophosphoesterase, partial [Myxococcota bacterium]